MLSSVVDRICRANIAMLAHRLGIGFLDRTFALVERHPGGCTANRTESQHLTMGATRTRPQLAFTNPSATPDWVLSSLLTVVRLPPLRPRPRVPVRRRRLAVPSAEVFRRGYAVPAKRRTRSCSSRTVKPYPC